MKKGNLLHICKVLYYLFILLFLVLALLAYLMKIDTRISVKGYVKSIYGKQVIEILILEQTENTLNINQTVLLENESYQVEGTIIAKDIIDIGLAEGLVERYEIQINSISNPLQSNCYYEFQLIAGQKNSILSYILKNL